MKCYYASYNVGNVDVWSSELYSNKDYVSISLLANDKVRRKYNGDD